MDLRKKGTLINGLNVLGNTEDLMSFHESGYG
jgi:hypothetical protein